jgi:putative MATE family efflux protein
MGAVLGGERGALQSGEGDARPASLGSRLRALRDRDHTQGSLLVSLVVLALPLIGMSLFGGVLFQIVDLKLVSGIGEDATTAVVVTNQSIRQIFFMLVMGASFGAQGLVSRHVGEGQADAADHVTGQTLLIGLGVSAFAALLGIVFARPLLEGMNVSPAVLEQGLPYLRWVLGLSIGFILTNLANAILNGAGDTTTPFLIAVAQTLVGLLAEWALIQGRLGLPALGIHGVALGAACGQLAGLLLVGRVITGGKARVHLRARHLVPDPPLIRRILSLSWPPAIQLIGGFLVTVFFIRWMGDFGPKAQAAYSIGLRLGMTVPMICFPLAGAIATLVGQAIGAGNVPRAWRAMGIGVLVHGGLMWSLAGFFFVFRYEVLGFFTDDAEVIDIGARLLVWQASSYVFMAFYFVFFRALQGAGDVRVPMLISVAGSLGFTLPLGWFLSTQQGLGPDGLFMASFAGAVLSTTTTGAWVATGHWTRARTRALDHATPSPRR